jgi:heme-degrading monooxygenase HmoA
MQSKIITRIWHGKTKIEHADEYLEYIYQTGVPDYKSIPGNLGVQVWRKKEGKICHFWTVTRWDSIGR